MGVFLLGGIFFIYDKDLLIYEMLLQYIFKIISWIYFGEGWIIDEFVVECCLFMFVDEIFDIVKYVFVLVEDQNFFIYLGYDICGIVVVVVEVL